MPLTVQDMLAAANAVVPRVDATEAQRLIDTQDALFLDIRDAPELEKMGQGVGSHHIPRGMLEFRADPASPYYDPELRHGRPVVLHCASGGRAALAGKLLLDMGYQAVYNIGGFKDWVAGGGAVDGPKDPGT